MPDTVTHRSLQGPATPETVEALHTELDQLWAQAGYVPETDRMAFTLAVVEATTNAVRHATPATRDPIQLRIDLTTDPRSLQAKLYEIGAAPPDVNLDADMPGCDSECGRGLALIQALVTTICLERNGNTNIWSLCRDRLGIHH